MFAITAIESIRLTHTVDRAWVQQLLRRNLPHRARELAVLSDADLGAELAAASHLPAIAAAFEALLAASSVFSRSSTIAVGVADQEFTRKASPGVSEGITR